MPFRAIFFGTPAIAVPALEALADIAEVVAVVCQPDRPAGRGLALQVSAVKQAALARGWVVQQPTKVRTAEFVAWVRDQQADIGVVLAYGRILTAPVLAAPRLGMVNLHASLLPAYRGAAPINWAIAQGETTTGISLMQMDEGLDTGPVYVTRSLEIGPEETAEELALRLGALAANSIRDDVARLLAGRLPAAVAQEEARATLAPILTKEYGQIRWTLPAQNVHDHVRAMQPWPGAATILRGKRFNVWKTQVVADRTGSEAAPGTVLEAERRRIVVACGEGAVAILQAQVAGRRVLDAASLLAGRAVAVGERLGEEQ